MKKYLAKLNQIAENNNEGIAVVLEGRDTAGKSSTIRALTQYLSPAWYSVVPSTKPSDASAMMEESDSNDEAIAEEESSET